MVPRTGNDGAPGARLLAELETHVDGDPSLARSVAFAMSRGDHFHGTYAYEKSVTRHYAANKFRHHRQIHENAGRREGEEEGGRDEERTDSPSSVSVSWSRCFLGYSRAAQ